MRGDRVAESEQGEWYVEDERPSVLETTDDRFTRVIGTSPKVCARIANPSHRLARDRDGTYHTGSCLTIVRR